MKLIDIDQQTLNAAYQHFGELYFQGDCEKALGLYFWKFLGMEKLPTFYGLQRDPYWHLPEEVAHKLKMLAGPHYATIAKIMELNGHVHNVELRV